MTAKVNPYDNATAKGFFKTLKREEVFLTTYRTYAEAAPNIATSIEDVHNAKRLHSSLACRQPIECDDHINRRTLGYSLS